MGRSQVIRQLEYHEILTLYQKVRDWIQRNEGSVESEQLNDAKSDRDRYARAVCDALLEKARVA